MQALILEIFLKQDVEIFLLEQFYQRIFGILHWPK